MSRFTTRARAVEMLGRQQIAGIPTAINELFKNAHDAYAEIVEVDYYRPEQLFVLRDDGLGMTLDDFETKWLALGTESKFFGSGGLASIAEELEPKILLSRSLVQAGWQALPKSLAYLPEGSLARKVSAVWQ